MAAFKILFLKIL